jgi:hypothetical protein
MKKWFALTLILAFFIGCNKESELTQKEQETLVKFLSGRYYDETETERFGSGWVKIVVDAKIYLEGDKIKYIIDDKFNDILDYQMQPKVAVTQYKGEVKIKKLFNHNGPVYTIFFNDIDMGIISMSQFGSLTADPNKTNYEDETHEFLLNYIDKYNKMVESDNMTEAIKNNRESIYFSIFWKSHKRSLNLKKVEKKFENIENTNENKQNANEEVVDTVAASN